MYQYAVVRTNREVDLSDSPSYGRSELEQFWMFQTQPLAEAFAKQRALSDAKNAYHVVLLLARWQHIAPNREPVEKLTYEAETKVVKAHTALVEKANEEERGNKEYKTECPSMQDMLPVMPYRGVINVIDILIKLGLDTSKPGLRAGTASRLRSEAKQRDPQVQHIPQEGQGRRKEAALFMRIVLFPGELPLEEAERRQNQQP